MPIEREGFDPQKSSPSRTIEYKGNSYEVFDLDRISEDQIDEGDRVLIKTESGNRYMLRRSRSGGSRLFAYRENDGFSSGGALGFEPSNSEIAAIGKALRLDVVGLGRVWQSTPVAAIELRKGIDTAIENSKHDPEVSSLADALIRHVGGRRKKDGPSGMDHT